MIILRLLVCLLILMPCAVPVVASDQETKDGIMTDHVRRRLSQATERDR